MQKQRLTVQNHEEFTELVDNSDFRIVRAIVEGCLQNLETTKRFIHILTVEVEEEDDIYELTLDRKEILGCLNRNLVHYEEHEWYEKCSEIVNAIEIFRRQEKKQQQHGKENNDSGSKRKTIEKRNSLKNKDIKDKDVS